MLRDRTRGSTFRTEISFDYTCGVPVHIFTASLLISALFAASGVAASPPFAGSDAFTQKNCAVCHNSSAPPHDSTSLSSPTNPATPKFRYLGQSP